MSWEKSALLRFVGSGTFRVTKGPAYIRSVTLSDDTEAAKVVVCDSPDNDTNEKQAINCAINGWAHWGPYRPIECQSGITIVVTGAHADVTVEFCNLDESAEPL